MRRYRPIRRLAIGGMAEVILACEVGGDDAGRLVVVKRVREELGDADEFIALFAEEVRLVMQLDHPNIVRVIESGSEDGVPFFVMEWLDGLDLRALSDAVTSSGQRLDPPVACRVAAAAARGLDHAHGLHDATGGPLEIVHRDISPHNLFVTRTGEVKILDFGIAKARGRLLKTRAGTARGKLAYLAPEQLTDASVDGRTDIFALGVVLWEMLTGKRLWHGSDDDRVARAIMDESAPPPSLVAPWVPRELDALVLAMLSKFSRTRPARALDVALHLEASATALGCHDAAPSLAASIDRYSPAPDVDLSTDA